MSQLSQVEHHQESNVHLILHKLGVGRLRPDSNELDNASEFTLAWQENANTDVRVDVYRSSRQGDGSPFDATQTPSLSARVAAITKALRLQAPKFANPVTGTDSAFDEAPFIIFIRA